MFGRERCRADTVTDRGSFKIPQPTSPPLFVLVQEGTGEITREWSSVSVCLYVSAGCVCHWLALGPVVSVCCTLCPICIYVHL